MKAATTSRFHSWTSAASRQRSVSRRSMSSSRRSIRVGRFPMLRRVGPLSDDARAVSVSDVGELRYGPARVPSRDSPEVAVALLRERGYTACEIDFEGGFWMDYPWAEQFGKLARRRRMALSVHAPIAGFMGHVERDKKHAMAVGMLDHSAGIAVAAGAEPVVFHPGFLLERTRKRALEQIVEQLADLRAR